MNQNELYQAIRRIAWGYVLIHVNFTLGTVNVLPNWWGYILFVMAIEILGKEEESTNLLIPLGKMLIVAELVFWVNECLLGESYNLYLISIIVSVISLYFHFQLLTNLANIANKYGCKEEKKILILRTVKTLLTTLLFLLASWETNLQLTTVFIVISIIVAVWICKVLFSFSNSINEKLKGQEVMVYD